jgi:hypothetical protein
MELPDNLQNMEMIDVDDKNGVPQPVLVRAYGNLIEMAFGFGELAVYSDDRPIEFWRTMPGFEEGNKIEYRHDRV